MLMISRRIGERIVIGKDIEITITEIHRSNVRIAVNAGSALVLRGEVHDAIERANRLAIASVIDDEALGALANSAAVAPTTGVAPTAGIAPTAGLAPTAGIAPTADIAPTAGVAPLPTSNPEVRQHAPPKGSKVVAR